jgi:nicotinamidase-related amidase
MRVLMMFHYGLVFCGALILAASASPGYASDGNVLELHTRSRTDTGSVERVVRWDPLRTVIIVCDMWDQNWCKGATTRALTMVPSMNQVLDAARNAGITIIHAPSETMAFYRDAPGRKLVQSAPPVRTPFPIPSWINPDTAREAPYPIDDSDGGCNDTPRCTQGRPWTRQVSTLKIMDGDGISDDGQEIYSFLRQRGITNVVLMGVHLNFCVLGRSFGVRAQTHLGMNVVLARDLTQALYNHRMPPHVSLTQADSLMVAHIERYWAPSIPSDDLLKTVNGVAPTDSTRTQKRMER